MVSAAAPNAHILLVESDSASFEDIGAAVDQAVAQGAKYVSNSYGTGCDSTPGSGEDPSETTELDAHDNHPGVAMVASSGDSDYGVSYPAASQYVTSVGGTALKRDTTTSRGWSESVWHNSYGGPGSGCSLYEPKPAFQTDTGCDKRAVADVAAVADPVTGVSVYQTYGGSGWSVYGGTSASSPIIAGAYAAAGTPAEGSYPNSYPYKKPSALNDVTQGSNGSCNPSYLSFTNQTGNIDVSTDGGATWTNVWNRTTTLTGPAHVEVPLTDYAGKPGVQLRFHFTGSYGYWWELDNVFVGKRTYEPVNGGLVAGTVKDANTGDSVVGATVVNTDASQDKAITAATPDDPALGGGFYWMFTTKTGSHPSPPPSRTTPTWTSRWTWRRTAPTRRTSA
ncbi:hypothetical protein [Streptomyces sp. NPDC048411]|uniref:hypothetical protein n=1 Tax=Streptomyces sp. NPDC048411 TaxID=3157206 RepID=UPI00345177A5